MNRALVTMFLGLLVAGCPKRIDFGPGGEITDPDALLAQVARAEARAVTLNGEAKLKVRSPQANGGVSLFVATSRPALLHLETLDFFGKPQAVLVSDGQRFGLYAADENRFYRGPASPANVSRFLPVVLPGEELVALLLGQAPRIPAEKKTLAVDGKKGVYVLTLTRGEVVQRLEVHPRFLRVTRSEVRGVRAYDAAFGDFAETPAGAFPREVVLDAAAADTRLELRYTDVSLNAAPDLTLFELTPPDGVPVVDVDEAGRERTAVPAG